MKKEETESVDSKELSKVDTEKVSKLASKLANVLQQKKLLADLEKELKNEILPLVKYETFENDSINISYRSASTALTFDSTMFKKAEPELYMKFNTKIRNTGETIACKLK